MKPEPREITPPGWCSGCPNYPSLRNAFVDNPDEAITSDRCKQCADEYIAMER